ncbi:MAG: ABC transporter permease [Oscillospiraceae bacterium]|nr:ABC transporter permease [Oscillospiraceae bacterium]
MKLVKKITQSKLGVICLVTILVVLFFGVTTTGFLSGNNLNSIMISMCLPGTIAIGMSMLLISGEIDLSAGYEACMGGLVCAMLIGAGLPWPVALLLTLVAGCIMGGILAFLVNKVGLFGFISSMAMISVYNGFSMIITKAQTITISTDNAAFFKIGAGSIWFFPIPFIIMVALMVVYGVILYKTEFGRTIYMTGGNRAAARLCGVNRKKITTILYINNGALAAFAGAVVAARMHNASPSACTTGATDAITAAVLGGVAFRGGDGNMVGCFIGLALVTFFNSGLTASGLQAYWQIVIQGLLLFAALCIDFFNARARQKALEG